VLRDSTSAFRPQRSLHPQTLSLKCVLFSKLANYIERSLKKLIAPADKHFEEYVFRLHQSRCYFVRLSLTNLATYISRDKLLSLETCTGIHHFHSCHYSSSMGRFFPPLTTSCQESELTIYRQIHKDHQISSLYYRFTISRPTCFAQGLGQSQWRDAFPLRQSCSEGTRWEVERGLH
jgi:hypothetical protein